MANAGYGNHTTTDPDDAAPKPGRPGEAPPRTPKDAETATETSDGHRDHATPGAGTLPDGPQGGDVDPGAG